jgi:hypothetical protein
MTGLPLVLMAANEVQLFCAERAWHFCFIGGVAVQRWGEPRFTQDVDLTLITGFGDEASYVDALLAALSPRQQEARQFALEHRVLLLRTGSGVDIDIALGALPFEERSVARASPWTWAPGQTLTTCSAEDLVVHKVFAGRDRDWGDVEGVLVRQHRRLRLDIVRAELAPLLELKQQPEALEKLDRLLSTVNRRLG